MKRLFTISLIITLILCSVFCIPANAAEVAKTETTIEYLENGDYIETTITYFETNTRAATKSGSKTSNYKNSDGETMWSVTVNGTFTYNGTTSSCTSVSRSASASGSGWSIKSSSCTKSGNCASATATASYKKGLISYDKSATVNLYCSPYGILS
ncbi:MAG: hypothetical protein E7563_06580 [Ruminococcaceae bacterium]|nr:hypothetical protein [Oscillospiraceae bacterium]